MSDNCLAIAEAFQKGRLVKKQTTIKTKSTPNSYLQFLQQAALQGVGLDSAEVSVDRLALAEASAKEMTLPVSLDADFQVILHTDDRLIVGADFKVQQTRKTADGDAGTLFSVKCAFSALFHLGVVCDGVAAARFSNTEAKLIFWPYLRHFISDITYRMAITPVLIPLMTAAHAESETK